MSTSHLHTITPYLVVKGASELIEFAKRVFSAEELGIQKREDGTVMHAEIRIGDSVLMIADATEQWPSFPSMLYVQVQDADTSYNKAVDAGAKSVMAPYNAEHGVRMAGFEDAVGNSWWPSSPLEKK